MVFLNPKIPTSQNYYNIKFNDHNLDWKSIYLLPRKVTLDSHTRIFQYKILNNILYLMKSYLSLEYPHLPSALFVIPQKKLLNICFVYVLIH